MRTTLIIDDDVMFAARDLAKAKHKSVSAVVSDLLRKGYQADREASVASGSRRQAGRLPQFPSRGGIVTNEQVNALREELGI
ncbi:MAG: hypothetical protein LBK95_09315 [Bifidobacteriaceae bacterium]|nr:hypothetical protein [Bifidobacteriaceae bacterium]